MDKKYVQLARYIFYFISVEGDLPECHWPTKSDETRSIIRDRSIGNRMVSRAMTGKRQRQWGRDEGVAHLDPSYAWASWALSSCCAKVPGCCCRRCCCAAATRSLVRACRDGDDDGDDGGADDDGGDTARCWVAAAVARSRRNCRRGCSRDRGGCFCCPWSRTLRTPP